MRVRGSCSKRKMKPQCMSLSRMELGADFRLILSVSDLVNGSESPLKFNKQIENLILKAITNFLL